MNWKVVNRYKFSISYAIGFGFDNLVTSRELILLLASEIRRQIYNFSNDKSMNTISDFAAKLTGNNRVTSVELAPITILVNAYEFGIQKQK